MERIIRSRRIRRMSAAIRFVVFMYPDETSPASL